MDTQYAVVYAYQISLKSKKKTVLKTTGGHEFIDIFNLTFAHTKVNEPLTF